MGGGVWLGGGGGTYWGDCGRKVSTQRKHACGNLQVQMCGESAKELHLHSVAY